jgi:Helix-turn-helix domain
MSISAIRWAIDQEISDPSVKLTLILLANCMNSETGKCCPSLRYLAEKCCQSERTVQRHLRDLVTDGFIAVTCRVDPSGRQQSNAYNLNLNGNGKSARRDGVGPEDGMSRASGWEGVAGAGGAGARAAVGDVDKGVTDDVDEGVTGDAPYMNQKEEPEERTKRKEGREHARSPAGFTVSPAEPEPAIPAEPDSIVRPRPSAERESARQSLAPEESRGRAARQGGRPGPLSIPIPADLELDPQMLAFAEERGWDWGRCEREFQQFQAYYAAKGQLSADWGASWKSWVLRGLKFDDKERREARGRSSGATMADTLLAHAATVARQECNQ